jgi:hypothetical protein
MADPMGVLIERLRARLVPAVLTAVGVSLIAAGLLGYTDPTSALSPSGAPTSPSPQASSSGGLLTFPPLSPQPSSSGAQGKRVATRVVVPALGIDLPVLPPGGPNAFPLCNVALYIGVLHQPGENGATYIYAHARTGMFLPLLTQSESANGKRMIGMIVQVFTSDDRVFWYEVTRVRRHQSSLDDAFAATTPQLWLQTSEGPNASYPKLQVVAQPLFNLPADHRQAHPVPHPQVCG